MGLARAAMRRAVRAALLLSLGGCSQGVLDPQGPIGVANRTILFNALEIMLLIVVPTIAAGLLFAWWFRASNSRATYQPGFAYSGRIEIIVWSIPTLVILKGGREVDRLVGVQPREEIRRRLERVPA